MLTLCCCRQQLFFFCDPDTKTSVVSRSGVSWKRSSSDFTSGYGKSLIFHLLPSLLLEKNRRSSSLPQLVPSPLVVLVISPLNSLMNDQLRRINSVRNRAAVLSLSKLTFRSVFVYRIRSCPLSE